MPFKSKAQQRFMFAAESRGELPKGTAKRWADETKSFKRLPEKVKKSADKQAPSRWEGAVRGSGSHLATAGLLTGATVGAGLAARDLKRGDVKGALKKFTGATGTGWTLGALGGTVRGALKTAAKKKEKSEHQRWANRGALTGAAVGGTVGAASGIRKYKGFQLAAKSPLMKEVFKGMPAADLARAVRTARGNVVAKGVAKTTLGAMGGSVAGHMLGSGSHWWKRKFEAKKRRAEAKKTASDIAVSAGARHVLRVLQVL